MKKTTRQDNQEKWYLRVEDYLSREIKQTEFCEESGVNKATFAYWLKKYRVGTEEKKQTGFITLQPHDEPVSKVGGHEITLRRGAVELSFSTLPNLETLIPLIQALA